MCYRLLMSAAPMSQCVTAAITCVFQSLSFFCNAGAMLPFDGFVACYDMLAALQDLIVDPKRKAQMSSTNGIIREHSSVDSNDHDVDPLSRPHKVCLLPGHGMQ